MSDDDDLDYNQRLLVDKVVRSAFFNITDSIIDTHSAVVVLAITITLEICGLGMFFVAHDKVMTALNGSDVGVWTYVSIGVFVVGFLNAFAVYRLIANKWPHSGSGLNSWLVSISAGLLNVLLFFALTTSLLR
jgi:hypothetical protein